MKLKEFMTTKIKFIESDRSVYDAIERMVDKRIRSLVVPFSSKETGYGVITARDIVFRVLAKGLDPQKIKVAEIASTPIVCADQNMEVLNASALMQSSNVARLFVCDADKLIGVVSLVDIMDAVLIKRARGENVSG
jgi:CBS domain-containing protein